MCNSMHGLVYNLGIPPPPVSLSSFPPSPHTWPESHALLGLFVVSTKAWSKHDMHHGYCSLSAKQWADGQTVCPLIILSQERCSDVGGVEENKAKHFDGF